MATINLSGAESGSATGEAGLTLQGTSSVQSTTKRTGTYAFQTNPTTTGTGNVAMGGPAGAFSLTTLYDRFYFYIVTAPGSTSEPFWTTNQATTPGAVGAKAELRLNSNRTIAIYNFSSLVATGSTVLDLNTWYRIEINLVKGTSGSYDVRINGTTEISGTINTDIDSASNFAHVYYGKLHNRNSQTVNFLYDDVLLKDNAFPGAGEIKVCKATGDGTYTAWTGDWNDVKELPPNDDTNYVSSTTQAQVETVNVEDTGTVGITGTVNAVKSNVVARRVPTSGTSGQIRLRSSATDDDTADIALTQSFAAYGKIYDTNPSGGAAWTLSAVDGVEVGIEHNQSQAGRELRATAMYVMVDSTPAAVTRRPNDRRRLMSRQVLRRATYTA